MDEKTMNQASNMDHHTDVDAVMKKYDRESNQRIWTGKAGIAVKAIIVLFSLWCIYVPQLSAPSNKKEWKIRFWQR